MTIEEEIAMELANQLAEANRETPLGELMDDDQGISDQFCPVSGEMD